MTLVTDIELPEFDYFDPALKGARFHEVLKDLHRRSPVAGSRFGYFVFDRGAVAEMLRDRDLVPPLRDFLQLVGISDQRWLDWRMKGAVQAATGADHSRLRQAVARFFTPRAVERLRLRMRANVAALWQELAGKGRCEFVADYARKLPAMAIGDLLGLPREHERLAHWSTEMGRMYDLGDPDAPAAVVTATNEVRDFLAVVAEERRRRPGEDLISALVGSAEADRPLERDECIMLVIEVIQGGTKTTAAELGHAMRLFAEHPDQWRLLASRPDLAEKATEEVLRFEPIVPFDPRTIPLEREIAGVTYPSGSLVFACIATANRDPELFANPDRFDVAAERNEESFSFGPGRRYCLGAALARAEIQETLRFLPARMLDPRVDGEIEFGSPTAGIYAMKAVPISFAVARER